MSRQNQSREEGGGFVTEIPQLGRLAFTGSGETENEALLSLAFSKRIAFTHYLKNGIEIPEPAAGIDVQVDKFLDAFMLVEYKGHEHLVARQHYKQVFQELIPKYFEPGQLSTK